MTAFDKTFSDVTPILRESHAPPLSNIGTDATTATTHGRHRRAEFFVRLALARPLPNTDTGCASKCAFGLGRRLTIPHFLIEPLQVSTAARGGSRRAFLSLGAQYHPGNILMPGAKALEPPFRVNRNGGSNFFVSTRFLHANRYPPRIQCGAGFR